MTAELLARYVPDWFGSDDSWLRDFERARKALLYDYRILVLWLAFALAVREPAAVAATAGRTLFRPAAREASRSEFTRWYLILNQTTEGCYFLRSASQASKIGRLLGSMEVNAIPIPPLFRA
jgi:hypothetical protein